MSKAATVEAVTVAGEGKGIFKTRPVSQQLASFAGERELTRGSALKKVWEYVKLHNLQVCLILELSKVFTLRRSVYELRDLVALEKELLHVN